MPARSPEHAGFRAAREVAIPPLGLPGTLSLPRDAAGLVLFAHGSGSSRASPRNRAVAETLLAAGIGTLLFDLLTVAEEDQRRPVFDVELLSARLVDAIDWLAQDPQADALPFGLFGASTGAAAALTAAGLRPERIAAVVSRGGRVDLAAAPERVLAPVLLVVGARDDTVLALNRETAGRLAGEARLDIIAGAGHLFEEAGALADVAARAAHWFSAAFAAADRPIALPMRYRDRREAGAHLARRLASLRACRPVILALPRGGVPVAREVANALHAPLDLVLVRKIGAPRQPELAVAAVVNGAAPEVVRNAEVIRALGLGEADLAAGVSDALREIERRRRLYLSNRPHPDIAGRVAILVDDGIATGATIEAALRATRRRRPQRLVLAVPVGPPDVVARLKHEADEVHCLSQPAHLGAVGQFYADFSEVSDETVRALLDQGGPAT